MRIATVVGLTLVVGCSFDANVPLGTVVRCASDDQCPARHACDLVTGQCVSQRRPVRSVELAPARGRAGARFELTVVPEADFALPPVVRAVPRVGAGAPLEFTPLTDFPGWTHWALSVQGSEPEGTWDVLIDARLTTGENYLRATLGSFELDFSPPALTGATLAYLPTHENALASVGLGALATAATVGTTVEVVIDLDEPLGSAPTLAFAADAGVPGMRWALEPGRTTPQHQVFSATLGPPAHDAAQGPHALQLAVADALGNATVLPLPPVVVLTQTPDAPPTSVPGAVVYRRQPAGDETSRLAVWGLRASPGTFPPGGALQLVLGAVPVAASGIDPDGGVPEFTFSLARDEPVVSVRRLDAAGNASALVEVLDEEWVARLGPGAPSNLPQALCPRPTSVHALILPAEDGLVAGPRAWPVLVEPGLAWESVTPLGADSRARAADPIRGGVACLVRARDDSGGSAGCAGRPALDQAAATATLLLPSFGVLELRGVLLLDGGLGATPTPDAGEDLLGPAAWDPSRERAVALTSSGRLVRLQARVGGWASSQLAPATGPSARTLAAFAWDVRRDRFVVFGGAAPDGGLLGDTWVFADGGWHDATSSSGPSARAWHRLAPGARAGQLVLVGGLCAGGACTDAWAFDDGWRALDAGPVAGLLPDVAADPARDRVLVTGSYAPDGGSLSQAWSLGAEGWRELPLASPADLPNSFAFDLAWGSSANGVVGLGARFEDSDGYWYYDAMAWSWDGARAARASALWPPRGNATLGPLGDGVLVHGGSDLSGRLHDFWVSDRWADGGWSPRVLAVADDAGVPSGVAFVNVADGGLLLVGDGPFWQLDLDAGTARRVADDTPDGSVRTWFGCGGAVCSASSSGARGVLLERWDGQWTGFANAQLARPLWAGETDAGLAVYAIEQSFAGSLRDEGELLLRIEHGAVSHTPVWRPGCATCPVPATGAVVLDVGRRRLVQLSQVALELPVDRRAGRPSVVARVTTTMLDPRRDELRSVTVRARAGAGAGATAGVRLRPWRYGRFDDEGAADSGAARAQPGDLSVRYDRPDDLRLLRGAGPELGFELSSLHDGALLEVDAVTITISFRRGAP